VKWTGTQWLERIVASQDGAFVFLDAPPGTPELRARLASLPPVPAGYETEINPGALEWVNQLASRLERGFVLAIDYGWSREEYYRPERTVGTLSAYASHRREPNPLVRPGEVDLTAHVDFTSVAERGRERGLHLAGFTDQHHFMVGLSRLHFPDAAPANSAAQKELRALRTLMHPDFLGRSFKALCLSKGFASTPPLAGFHFASDPSGALGLA
jgi:SAM-dependent MidA family methyltransferase